MHQDFWPKARLKLGALAVLVASPLLGAAAAGPSGAAAASAAADVGVKVLALACVVEYFELMVAAFPELE